MKKRMVGIVLGLAAMLIVGCSEKEMESISDSETEDVLVSVNGVALTKPEVEQLVAASVKLRRHKLSANRISKNPKQAQQEERQLRNYELQLRRGAADNFIVRQLILGSVGTVDVAPTNVTARLDMLAKASGYADAAAMKIDLTAAELAGFERQAIYELRFEEADRQFKAAIPAEITETEIDAAYKRLAEINATAAATNSIAFQLATNTYNRIVSGELSFDHAVKEISQDSARTATGLWGAFKIEELRKQDPKLATLIDAGAKEGDVLPPVEADNQLLICKLGPNNRGSQIIYRIVFRLALEWKIPTRDTMRNSLAFDKRKEGCRKKFKELKAAAKIELSSEAFSRIYSNNEGKHTQK